MGTQPAMEKMVASMPIAADRSSLWRDRRVFLTGHTGFKGSWLSLWLKQWGAKLYGYSLAPESPSLFEQAGLQSEIPGEFSDIRDVAKLTQAMTRQEPEVVFHLAAQPLVRLAYEDPVMTYATNVMGTVHVLEAVRQTPSVRVVVVITSDKCYENREWIWPYRESDRLGGHDPYSNSKACAEFVCHAYHQSYFADKGLPLLATVRAGNVVGGGDWAKDRLIPDAVRAFSAGKPLVVRYPKAVRPWQHVLEALNGYLLLSEVLLSGSREHADSWNFGPFPQGFSAVEQVVQQLVTLWQDKASWQCEPAPAWKEAGLLTLDISKATRHLSWQPKLTLEQTLKDTISWYKHSLSAKNMLNYTLDQIKAYAAR